MHSLIGICEFLKKRVVFVNEVEINLKIKRKYFQLQCIVKMKMLRLTKNRTQQVKTKFLSIMKI